MAQLVARLVRNEKVGGSNPPSSTTGRHPIRMSVFVCLGALVWCLSLCCLWRRWCSGRSVVMLCGALPPPTGTAAGPAYNAIPAAASDRSYAGVEPLFRAADLAEASSHDVRHRGSAPGLAANRRAMTAPLSA